MVHAQEPWHTFAKLSDPSDKINLIAKIASLQGSCHPRTGPGRPKYSVKMMMRPPPVPLQLPTIITKSSEARKRYMHKTKPHLHLSSNPRRNAALFLWSRCSFPRLSLLLSFRSSFLTRDVAILVSCFPYFLERILLAGYTSHTTHHGLSVRFNRLLGTLQGTHPRWLLWWSLYRTQPTGLV